MKKIKILLKCLMVGFLALICSTSFSQNNQPFPTKPITVIVPFPPGGGADTLIRIMSPELTKIFRQSIIVENRPGASGSIGANIVAQSAADGYTLLMGSTAAVTEKNIQKFVPIALVSASPYVLTANPSLNFKSAKDVIDFAKSHPGQVKFGSSGVGSASHLSGELFKSMANIQMLHVPYKGTGQALTDLLAGHIDIMFAPAQTVMPQIEASKLIALGVTSKLRSESLPKMPTISETGLPGYDSVGWFGLFAPAKTPIAVVDQLNHDVNVVLNNPQVRKEMLDRGIDPAHGSAKEYQTYLAKDQEKWSKLIKENNIPIE